VRESLDAFRQFLETAARRFPSKQALAKAIGITPGRLSRVLKGEHSLDVVNCLRLAKLTGDSPGEVLRVAGKNEVAELIEGFYGRAAPAIHPADRIVVDRWHALTAPQRELMLTVIDQILGPYYDGARVQNAPIDVPKPTQAIDASAHGGATRRDAVGGQKFERPSLSGETADEATTVPRAQRARTSKEAAAIDRLTRAAEQATPLGGSAGADRAARQHAATVGAIASSRRPRTGKHRR
jgi:transcriptional regulator with XRE-family HTH domain